MTASDAKRLEEIRSRHAANRYVVLAIADRGDLIKMVDKLRTENEALRANIAHLESTEAEIESLSKEEP